MIKAAETTSISESPVMDNVFLRDDDDDEGNFVGLPVSPHSTSIGTITVDGDTPTSIRVPTTPTPSLSLPPSTTIIINKSAETTSISESPLMDNVFLRDDDDEGNFVGLPVSPHSTSIGTITDDGDTATSIRVPTTPTPSPSLPPSTTIMNKAETTSMSESPLMDNVFLRDDDEAGIRSLHF